MVDLAISSHPAHSLAQPWYPAYQEREKRRAAEKERKRQEAKERKKEEKQRQEEEKIRDARDREELRDAVARNIELAKKAPPHPRALLLCAPTTSKLSTRRRRRRCTSRIRRSRRRLSRACRACAGWTTVTRLQKTRNARCTLPPLKRVSPSRNPAPPSCPTARRYAATTTLKPRRSTCSRASTASARIASRNIS